MEHLDNIQNLIYTIRGQRVMLDYDLARLYHVETGELKRQVRRNIERFEGDDFMFEISHEELLRCQIGISSWGGSRKRLRAYPVQAHRFHSPRRGELTPSQCPFMPRTPTACDRSCAGIRFSTEPFSPNGLKYRSECSNLVPKPLHPLIS
jgi:hypothetical protein